MKLYTTIYPHFIKQALKRGIALASIGIFILLWGSFQNTQFLTNYGFFIISFALLFIAWGLIPYKRLNQLATTPDHLIIEQNRLEFLPQGKQEKKVIIAFQSIERIKYFENSTLYGIGINFKKKGPKKWLKAFDCDFFIPYFSKRSFEDLKKATLEIT